MAIALQQKPLPSPLTRLFRKSWPPSRIGKVMYFSIFNVTCYIVSLVGKKKTSPSSSSNKGGGGVMQSYIHNPIPVVDPEEGKKKKKKQNIIQFASAGEKIKVIQLY